MPVARAPLSSVTPWRMNSSSSAAATSGSLSGSTCWRETSSVTFEPRASNMCVNSTPVTPGADHHHVLRQLGRRVRLAGREHPLAVHGRELGYPGSGAGGDHDEVGFELLDAASGLDDDFVRAP